MQGDSLGCENTARVGGIFPQNLRAPTLGRYALPKLVIPKSAKSEEKEQR